MKSKGLSSSHVGDVYAIWWIAAHDAVHGHTGTRSTGTYQAVKKQAAAAMRALPQLQGATSALKQEMADALLVQAIMIDVAVEQAKADPAKLKAVGQAVAQGARKMGLDLKTMVLSETGFAM